MNCPRCGTEHGRRLECKNCGSAIDEGSSAIKTDDGIFCSAGCVAENYGEEVEADNELVEEYGEYYVITEPEPTTHLVNRFYERLTPADKTAFKKMLCPLKKKKSKKRK